MSIVKKILLVAFLIVGSYWIFAKPIKGNGKVTFLSQAPQETIEAKSDQLRGVVDWDKSSFYFTIDIQSFMGFNSPMQRIHFNENYMESATYANATFSGKIIESVNVNNLKKQTIRAKGKMNIHGVAREVIIPVTIYPANGKINCDADFNVMLQDYNIKIPRIVNRKLSPKIQVNVTFSTNIP